MGRGTEVCTSVYLCPYFCKPLFTFALGRGTQRYTEVWAEVTEVCRGTQRYAEVSRCMQRYARSCIEKYLNAYGHIQMLADG